MAAQTQYFCYIEPKRLTIEGNNGANVQLPLGSDLTTDLEIVDTGKLVIVVEQFLQANSILSGSVILLLAPQLLFEQDLSTFSAQEKSSMVSKFVDTVPFEVVESKLFVVNGKERLIATNKEFFDSVKRAFEKKGVQVHAIVPYSILQATFPELATTINAAIIFSKFDSLKQYDMGIHEIIHPTAFETKTGLKGGRDMALLGVFGFLLLILFWMVGSQYLLPKTTQQIAPGPMPTRALTFPTPSPIATSSAKIH